MGGGVFFVLAVEELVQMVHMRDGVEVVFLWWVGGHPLQAAGVPRVKRSAHLAACRYHDVDEEQAHTDRQNQRTNRRDEIPETEVEEPLTRSRLSPLIHTTRLALQTEDMHRTERHVHTDDHEPEVP